MPKPPSYMAKPEEDGLDLWSVLTARLKVSRRAAKRLLDERRVFVQGKRIWMAHHRLHAGDRIEIQGAVETPAVYRGLPILFEDAHYLVIDKPPALLSNGADSVEERLREERGDQELMVAHRLDRDTSGCLLVARGRAALDAAIGVFREHDVLKLYHAICVGAYPRHLRELNAPVDGQPAVTEVEVADSVAHASHLLVRIPTGRTHQIRKHLQGAGYPIAGDRAYGTAGAQSPVFRALPRQMLHAAQLEFPHPLGGKVVRARSPLPKDFAQALRALGLK